MSIIAIIPARGGSKGIPHKNVTTVAGRPLIEWSIKHCLNAQKIDAVYVSSDSSEILEVSKAAGADCIVRPKDISGDTASSESAWIHAITHIKNQNIQLEKIVGIQATSPIRDSEDLDKAIQYFEQNNLDSLFSSNMIEDHNIWRMDGEVFISDNYDYKKRWRRQDIQPKYLENGNFYIFTPEGIINSNNRLSGKIGTYVMDKHKSFQIDEQIDIDICTAMITHFSSI